MAERLGSAARQDMENNDTNHEQRNKVSEAVATKSMGIGLIDGGVHVQFNAT